MCNSGAESIEAALKFARLHSGAPISSARCAVSTDAPWARSAPPIHRNIAKPFSRWCRASISCPYNKIEKLDALVDDNTAAVLLELVQGEGGVNPIQPDYITAVRKLCSERGALLIIDEIQTGFCRTGKFFACEHFDLQPDMLCLAKALGGGVPIGATLISDAIKIEPGLHGTTFGGNPLACAAALAAIEVYQGEGLAERAAELGAYFERELKVEDLTQVRALRRLGLMIGIELKQKVQEKLAQLLEAGIIALPAGPNVIRMLPPLIVDKPQIDRVVAVLRQLLA